MKKSRLCILFDSILEDYQKHYGEEWEIKLVADLKQYLSDLSKNSEITLITNENVLEITTWLLKNDLYNFIENVTNPIIR